MTVGDGLVLAVLVAASASAFLGALRWLARAALAAAVAVVLLTAIARGKGHPWVAPVHRLTHSGEIVRAITGQGEAVLRRLGAVGEPAGEAPSAPGEAPGSPRSAGPR